MAKTHLSEPDLITILESLDSAIILYDRFDKVIYYNLEFVEMWGEAILVNQTKTDVDSLIFTQLQTPLKEKWGGYDGDTHFSVDLIHKNQKDQFRLQEHSIILSNGNKSRVQQWRNVSHEYELIQSLRYEHGLLLSLINTIPEQVYIKDRESRFIRINPSLANRYGIVDLEVVIGKSDADFYSIEHAEQTAKEEKKIMETGKGVYNQLHHEVWHDGRESWNLSTKLPLRDENDDIIGIIGISHDITDHKLNEARIWRQANFDELTGLSNRQHLKTEFDRVIFESRQANMSFAFILLDLDGFKEVNDTYGHEYGDLLLGQVAERLRKVLRKSDIIARLGGDEFAIVIGNIADQSIAIRLTQKLVSTFEDSFIIQEHNINVTASLGVVIAVPVRVDLESILRQADQAMYRAKQYGKNGFSVYTSEIAIENKRRIFLSDELKLSLRSENFYLMYQPLFSKHSQNINQIETYCRWHHKIFSDISPQEFLPVAESNGCIFDLENNTILKVIFWLKKFYTHNKNAKKIRISVNISPVYLTQPDELEKQIILWRSISASALSSLALEIPEETFLHPSNRVLTSLNVLSQYEIDIIIDNAGTGYLSFSLLQQFNIRQLKLHPSLTKQAKVDHYSRHTVKALVAMAHALSIEVVTKSVETYEEFVLMQSLGIDAIQGNFVQRPMLETQLMSYCE